MILDDTLRQFCIKTPRAVGTAVRRNRAKRIIREMLRLNLDRIRPGTRAVIVVRSLDDDQGKSLRADMTEFIENA
jgi:ribonuclease P protein component